MKARINDSAALKSLQPTDIMAYLRSTGWRRVRERTSVSVWQFVDEQRAFFCQVPMDMEFADFPWRVSEVIETISAAEDRSEVDIFTDIQSANSDVVRVSVGTGWRPTLLASGVLMSSSSALIGRS